MDTNQLGIILQFSGILLAGFFSSIRFEESLAKFNEALKSRSHPIQDFWKRGLGILQFPEKATYIGLFVFLCIYGIIISGWIYSNPWLFWSGIIGLLFMTAFLFIGSEPRKQFFPQGTRIWQLPFYLIKFWVLMTIGLLLILIIWLISAIGSIMILLIIKIPKEIKTVKEIFLILGLILVLIGLILQFRATVNSTKQF